MNFFEGMVQLYNEEMYINMNTGEGVDRALKKIDPLLTKMAIKTYIANTTFDDRKQDLVIIALDGFKKYNPDKGVKLSTFIHRHMIFKLISKLKTLNQKSRNANYLKDKDSSQSDFKIRQISCEIPISNIGFHYASEYVSGLEESISNSALIAMPARYCTDSNKVADSESDSMKIECLMKVSDRLGEPYKSIVKEVFQNKRSIKEVSEVLNIPAQKISNSIKKLSREPEIKEYTRG